MICPYCNAEISDGNKFCENCGSALLVDTPIVSAAEPVVEPVAEPAVTDPIAAQPAQTQPYQQPSYGTPAQPQAQPYASANQYGQAPLPPNAQYASTQAQPSVVPFVLAIIALVCAILGLFPVSIILAIVALVLNSGQKKRGEFSTKQTPTFVMSLISIILSAIIAIATFVLGAALWTAIQSGELDDLEEIIEQSATTGVLTSDPVSTAESKLAGEWEIDSMFSDGEMIDDEDIELMQSIGLNVVLDLDPDGSASLDMFGEELIDGTWEDLGGGVIDIAFEGEHLTATYDGSLLTLDADGDWLSFHKA